MAFSFMQEGLRYLLEAAISEQQTPPVNFYVGLSANAPSASNHAMAAVTEITGTNYARQTLASSAVGFDTSETYGTNDWHLVSADAVFTGDAAGDWDEALGAFLTTAIDGSGKLIAWIPLSAGRTLTSALDSLTVSFDLRLTNADA